MAKTADQETILMLAERVKLLFGFCADLIPHKEILKDVMEGADNNMQNTMAMAPVIGAFGGDWEEMQFNANIKAKRASALFNLVKVLDETETEMIEHIAKQKEREKGRKDLARILGASGLN